jgi:3-oxoacyl-(acyl-carrier-protein) synthase
MIDSDPVVITGSGVLTGDYDNPARLAEHIISCAGQVLSPVMSGSVMPGPVIPDPVIPDPVITPFVSKELISSYHLDKITFKGFADYIKIGFIAAFNALESSGFNISDSAFCNDLCHPEMRGLFVSTGTNGKNVEGLFPGFEYSGDLEKFGEKGISYVHPKWILTALSNNLIFFLSSEFGFKGDNNNCANCLSGGAAMIEEAFFSVKEDLSSIALAGGSDSPVNWQSHDDLTKSGLVSSKGFLTQAGASLILQKQSRAAKHNIPVLGIIKSVAGSFCSGKDLVFPDPEGSEICYVLKKLFKESNAACDSLTSSHKSLDLGSSRCLIILNALDSLKWQESEINGILRFMSEIKSDNASDLIRITGLKPFLGNSFSASFITETVIALEMLKTSRAPILDASFSGHPYLYKLKDYLLRPYENPDFNKIVILSQGLGGNAGGVLIERP